MQRIIALTLLIMFLQVGAFAQGKQHKIVFQFTNAHDTLQQKAFVKQLQNLKEHWPDAQYEVVVYNQGLELLMPSHSKHLEAVKELHSKGVRFVVCENTMKNRKIGKEAFIPIVEYVKAGIAEIVEKQEAGWSYVKGGF